MGADTERGLTAAELLVALTILSLVAAFAVPLTAQAIDAGRARQAAGFIASRFRLARQDAVTRAHSVGVVFDRNGAEWEMRVCVDRNGNGLRRSEIDAGVDSCVEGPYRLDALFPGTRVVVDPGLRGPDGEPGSADAVRFGRSDIASFSPLGTCTAGSLFVRSRHDAQFVVRVAGVTGRIRILRYEPLAREWRDA
jgi:prepilin-type N-terminal cleavage/methylation domain-containing protein